MKKVININFHGRVVMIEETAFENLKQYIDSLSIYFAHEEGRDEIINDIEWRISELFDDIIKKGNSCVTEEHLEAIIKSIGRPQDLQEADDATHYAENNASQTSNAQTATGGTTANSSTTVSTSVFPEKRLFRDETNKKIGGVCAGIANYLNIDHSLVRIITVLLAFAYGISILIYIVLWAALPGAATKEIGSSYRKLYRDPLNKKIGGVCSGLAHYFNMEIWIVRLIFVLGLLSPSFMWTIKLAGFSGGLSGFTFLTYLILLIVVPYAKRPSDFLSMKGENIDLNSIKTTVQDAGNDDKKKVTKQPLHVHGSDTRPAEPAAASTQTAEQPNAAAQNYYYGNKTTFGDVILTILKVFAYIILGCITITLVATLASIGFASLFALPYTDLFFEKNWENVAATIALVCFIWVPVIGICIWGVRKIIGYKHRSPALRNSFLILWIAGLIMFVALITSSFNNVKYESELPRQNIALANPDVNKLVVDFNKDDSKIFLRKKFKLFPWRMKNKFYINNLYLDIDKSADSSFHVYLQKSADGSSAAKANEWADKIEIPITQTDSVLKINKGILIDRNNKFRNQAAEITIEVPVGKKIVINNSYYGLANVMFGKLMRKRNFSWDTNTEYIMTNDGLVRADGKTFTDDIEMDEDVSFKKGVINGQTKYYVNDREVDSATFIQKSNELKKHLKEEEEKLKKQQQKYKKIQEEFNRADTTIAV